MSTPSNDRILHLYSEASATEPDTLAFWEEEIKKHCLHNRILTVTLDDLVKAYIVNDIYPSSCEPALKHLNTTTKSVLRKEDLAVNVDMVSTLLSKVTLWSSTVLHGTTNGKNIYYSSAGMISEVESALMKFVSELDERDTVVFVKSSHSSPVLFTFVQMLRNSAATTNPHIKTEVRDYLTDITEEDAYLIMGHMLKHNLAVLSTDGSMVKVLSHSVSTAATGTNLLSYFSSMIKPTSPTEGTTCKPPAAGNTITEADLASLQLRASIYQVEKRIDELNAGIAGLLNKAKACKAEGSTQEALVHLKLKRTREQARERLTQSLLGLMEAQDMIGQCAMNVLLTNAYRSAANGLRSTRTEVDLTADSAAQAMESFQEEMEEMSHISDVLNTGFQSDESPETQAELEAELQLLLNEAEQAQQGTPVKPVQSSVDTTADPATAEPVQSAVDTTADPATAEPVQSAVDTTADPATAEPVQSAVDTTADPATAEPVQSAVDTTADPATELKTEKKAGKGKKKKQQKETPLSYAGAVKTADANIEEDESLPAVPTHTVALPEKSEDQQQQQEEGEGKVAASTLSA